MITWDQIYNYVGAKDFIYFISSSSIQDTLWPVKIVFIAFTIFFFCAVIWFYINSSYLQYKFVQDASEFLSKGSYGLGKVTKDWTKIKRRMALGSESELKLAIIEADDYLYQVLDEAGFDGATFEELIENAKQKVLSDKTDILKAHQIRNTIVYDPNYKLDADLAKKLLQAYENVIKNVATV